MIRGVFKEFMRSLSPSRKKRALSCRKSLEKLDKKYEKNERKVKLSLKTSEILRNKGAELESPSFSDYLFGEVQDPKIISYRKKSIQKVVSIILQKIHSYFRSLKSKNLRFFESFLLLKVLFSKIISKFYKVSFDLILNYSKKMKSSFFSSNGLKNSNNLPSSRDLFIRRKSFDLKDQELWRKRHPSRFLSPDLPRRSLKISPEYENPFVLAKISEIRRKTLGDVKKPSVFRILKSTESEEGSESSDVIEIQENFKTEVEGFDDKTGKFEGFDEESQKVQKKEDFWAMRPVFKKKKIENLAKFLIKNLGTVKDIVFRRLRENVEEVKKRVKVKASKSVFEFLDFQFFKKSNLNLKHAFEKIIQTAQQRPKITKIIKTNKKPVLRAQKPEAKKIDPERPEKLLQSLDILRTICLKLKLFGFLSIIESKDLHPSSIQYKKGLRSIFRVLETKRFLVLCKTFTSIKSSLIQIQKLKQLKYRRLSQKILKTLQKNLNPLKNYSFSKIFKFFQLKKSSETLKKTLEKIEKRGKMIVKPIVWFSVISYAKQNEYKENLRKIKMENVLSKKRLRKIASGFM
jgi:hypothetical protein